MSKTKNYTGLKVAGVAALAFGLLAFKKKNDYESVIEKMTIDIDSIYNLRTTQGKAYLNMNVALHNPTDIDFEPYTAGLIKVKQIKVFRNNVEIGNAFHELYEIALPAKSNFLITNIKVELLLLNILNLLLDGQLDTNVSNYRVNVYVEALGKTWVIEQ
ncbi:MAG: hypothetical protein ACK4IZ_03180 [Flavobacterium sp.]|uniref:hypothetical protein n=1 Tax=Flavobacterium sp. TaxID=239 RepID=UPI00391881FB